MDRDDVVHIYNRLLFIKRNDIGSFAWNSNFTLHCFSMLRELWGLREFATVDLLFCLSNDARQISLVRNPRYVLVSVSW